jgi:RNA polymerase sigma-70 factor (ECF subfamily)
MRREQGNHTLQPTALVNEAYIRIVGRDLAWEGRAHFFGIAARIMRQILVDHARKRRATKRAGRRAASVSQVADPSGGQDIDVLALHEALEDLAGLDERQADIVQLRYFGGLTETEVATIKGLSPATVRRDLASARLWLGRRLRGA